MKKETSQLQKMLNVWAIILIIWSVYRTKFLFPEWIDEFLLKPIVFIVPVYYYVKNVERKKFFEALWIKKNNIIADSKIGVSIGLFFLGIIIFTHYLKLGNFSFIFNITLTRLLYLVEITTITAISEEILSRGFVTKRLYLDSKNQVQAAFLGSVLFTIIHIPMIMTNYKITGSYILVFIFTEFFLSIINSLIFLDRKSLLPSIQIHAIYNLALLLYL